jgi:CRISPR/Cas system CSM-associated protein Csm2 small subunit
MGKDRGKRIGSLRDLGSQKSSPVGTRFKAQNPSPGRQDDYLSGGYYEGENLKCDVYLRWARDKAKDMIKFKPTVSRNSLRSFFTMLRETKRALDYETIRHATEAWGKAESSLCKMEMLGEYQRKRGVINQAALDFLKQNIREARKGKKNLYGFVEHFQAVIAYLPERVRGV